MARKLAPPIIPGVGHNTRKRIGGMTVARVSPRVAQVKIARPVCGVEVEVASLVKMGNTHHSNVFPMDRDEMSQVIDYWKTRIPRPR